MNSQLILSQDRTYSIIPACLAASAIIGPMPPRSDRLARRAFYLGLRLRRAHRGWTLSRVELGDRSPQATRPFVSNVRALPTLAAVEAELAMVRDGQRAAEGIGPRGIW